MRTFIKYLTIFITTVFLNGCLENAVLVEVNPDGTGTMTVRMLMNADMSQMGAGMDQSGDIDVTEGIKSSLEDPAKYGEGVTLTELRKTENKKGWKGYIAEYAFEDITKIALQANEVEQEDGAGGSSSMKMENDITYRFEFTPGAPAELKLIPLMDGEEMQTASVESEVTIDEEDPFTMAGLEESSPGGGMDGMGDGMAQAMMASMAPMMQGMRISYLIKINGEITDTNAEHQPRDNTILVMDMQVGKLISDASAITKMQGGVEGLRELAATNHPGLKMQDPTSPLVVRFK